MSSQLQEDLEKCKIVITAQEKELQRLHAELELLKSDLALRIELTSELEVEVRNLEKKVHTVEQERNSAACKLNTALGETKGTVDQV